MHHETNGHAASSALRLEADGHKLIFTDAQGVRHTTVEPIRAFPISAPRHGIALCDAEGRELHWIESLDALPKPQQVMLEDALARRHFGPTIHRILKVSHAGEPSDWEVETDRGTARFSVRSEEDIRRLAGHRALVTDAHGIRYLIPDLRALDAVSSRIMEHYL
jgi:hypothetical protein